MNGSFAARIGDPHVCPMADPTPHVGGPVLGPGAPTVLIGGQIAALTGDQCACAKAPDQILPTPSTVVIANRPAARASDATIHGGFIATG